MPLHDFPLVSAKHVADARLFANRYDLIRALPLRENPVIAEIGVATGDFSEFLITELEPRQFVAFDTFELHRLKEIWGTPTRIAFRGLTHDLFYRSRMLQYSPLVKIEHGPSRERLAAYPEREFDLIYIDAGHEYPDVKTDAEQAVRLLARSGFLVFNDYILHGDYGIIPAVNELLAEGGWQVFGFALHPGMFCDIALYRDQDAQNAASAAPRPRCRCCPWNGSRA